MQEGFSGGGVEDMESGRINGDLDAAAGAIMMGLMIDHNGHFAAEIEHEMGNIAEPLIDIDVCIQSILGALEGVGSNADEDVALARGMG